MDCHSAAIWSMRATRCLDAGVDMGPSRRGASPDPSPSPGIDTKEPGVAIVLVGGSVRAMDIDEFYEADPRRRASAELELGIDWLGSGRGTPRVELRGGHRRALRAP